MTSKRVILYPWKMSSSGAKMVAAHLTTMGVDCTRVYGDRDYKPKNGDFIMGWGSGYRPSWMDYVGEVDCHFVNTPKSVCNSVEKVTALRLFKTHGVPHPEYTFDHEIALRWSRDGNWVCCRQQTEGMDGAGLVLATRKSEVVHAPLYTKFIPNSKEFRIYIFAGKVIDVLTKVATDETKDKHIRVTSNGYEYARMGNAHCTAAAKQAAINAVDALDLCFAGVDLVIGDDGSPYVLETNTAPSIGQITAGIIADTIVKYAGIKR